MDKMRDAGISRELFVYFHSIAARAMGLEATTFFMYQKVLFTNTVCIGK